MAPKNRTKSKATERGLTARERRMTYLCNTR